MVAEKQRPQVETRVVLCTHCERSIDIPATAMSVSCRHCHRRVIIEDLEIRTYHAVTRLATAGRVAIAKKGRLVAHVRVNDLEVEGAVKGDITALGRIVVGKKATIEGDVSCRTLRVEPGATLVGHFRVDPDFAPPPAAAADEDAEVV